MSSVLRAIKSSTYITFPQGAVTGKSQIIASLPLLHNRVALFTDTTPFHPETFSGWGQPGDRGTLIALNKVYAVEHAARLYVNKITHKVTENATREASYAVVGHIIDPAKTDPAAFCDAEVEFVVDEDYRNALSRQHTACHLTAIALNRAVTDLWVTSPKTRDALGSPDFLQATRRRALIRQDHSTSLFGLGKLPGLDVDRLRQNLPMIQARVNTYTEDWMAARSEMELACRGPLLDDLRVWTACLPEGTARLACTGTHVSSLLKPIRCDLSYREGLDGGRLEALTTIDHSKGF